MPSSRDALLAFTFCAASALARLGSAQSLQQDAARDVQALVSDGEKVFQASCSSQYCHGRAGAGGQGPRLSDHPLPPGDVIETVRDGRAGTNMAAFRNVLTAAEISAVAAYVGSLSKPSAAAMAADSGPSTLAVAIGDEKGTPAAGADVFFDATRLSSCRTCHSFEQRGGPLGVDFAAVNFTPEQVLASITHPGASPRYPVVAITLRDGEKLSGILANDGADTLQVFDVAIPPVRRFIPKSQIVSIGAGSQELFDHRTLGLTRQQQLDVAALLGSRQR